METYILINKSDIVQNQVVSQSMKDLELEFSGRTQHDIDLLKLYNITDYAKIYDNYVIYKIFVSSKTQNYTILEKYLYDTSKNKFVTFADKTSTIKDTPEIQNNPSDKTRLFGIKCEKCAPPCAMSDEILSQHEHEKIHSNKNCMNNLPIYGDIHHRDIRDMLLSRGNHFQSDEQDIFSDGEEYMKDDEEQSDQSEQCMSDDETYDMHEIEEKLKHMKDLRKSKRNFIEKFETEHQSEKDNFKSELEDKMSDMSFQKKETLREQEKCKENKRKFIVDRDTYENKLKNDIASGKLSENNIPSFFKNTYKILKELDDAKELDKDDAFEKFMDKYTQLVSNNSDSNCDDDPFGILS